MTKKYLVLFALALGLVACEKEEISLADSKPFVALVDMSTTSGRGTQVYFNNFYYKGKDITTDTVWIKIMSRAALPTKDCKVKLYAYNDSVNTLQANTIRSTEGVQYESFNSDNMQKLLVLHKGAMYDSIPLVLKRDPSLKTGTYSITVRLGDTDDIQAADHKANKDNQHTFVEIYVADGLAKPSNWPSYFGNYGPVKHDFMIRHTGDRWDEAFIKTIDYTQYTYYEYKFYYELIQENAQRAAQGLGPLTEDNGSEVSFYIVGS